MLNLPLIKWHIQELYKLLKVDPDNALTVPLLIKLETMLNSESLRRIETAPPDITDGE
jgi:hypothetical protein